MNIFSNKFRIAVITAVAAASLIWASQAAASPMREIERLTPPRTAICHFEGQGLGDIVVNARGKLTFYYVDRKLANALSRQRRAEYDGIGSLSGIPSQVFAYATKSKRNHALFVVRAQAMKGWKFDASLISVGGYTPVKGDIITGIAANPASELNFNVRDLSRGYDGFIGFFVPTENVKQGETISLGYAADRVEWQVPD